MDEILVNISSSIEEVNVVISEFRGRSAYQVWLDAGNVGTEVDFFVYIGQIGASGSFETQGRDILSGSVLNYVPVIVSGSSQIDVTQTQNFTTISSSIDTRLDDLESFSSSLNVTFATDAELRLTASAIENKINVTASLFNSFSSSINTTIKTKLDTDGVISGSSQVELNNVSGFTTYSASVSDTINQINISSQSANLRLNELEIESGSVRIRLNNLEIFSGSQNDKNITLSSYTQSIDLKLNGLDLYTGSNDTLNLTQNNRLDLLSTFSGSAISRLTSLELYTQSVDNNIENIIKAKLDDENVISGSSQLTSSYDLRYELQGRGILSGSVLNYIPVIVSQSSQIQLNGITGTTFGNDNFTFPQNLIVQGRLTAQEFYTEYVTSSVILESGSTKFGDTLDDTHQFTGSVSITGSIYLNGEVVGTGKLDETVFNSYTQSINTQQSEQNNRLNLLETESGSIRSGFNTFTQSINEEQSEQNNRLSSLETESGSIRTNFNSFTQSVNTEQNEQNDRLTLLETESGSIRSEFNSYTSSTDLRLENLESESGSIRAELNSYTSSADFRISDIENFTSSQSSLNQTFAVTGSNTFVGNQIFSGSIIFQDGSYIDNGWIHDYNTSQSLAWSNRQLYDENENTSINWGDRRLYNDTGNSTVLLWGGENPEFFGTSSWAISSSWAPTILPTGVISSSQQITDFGFLSSSITTGDITFDGIKIIGAGTGSGDGSGYSTMELVPDNSLYVNDQYIIVDPTSPGHIHLRAGGPIDQTLAQLIIGGEKANLTVRDQNNSYDLEHHVLINTTATDSSSYTWKFKNDGTLTFPDSTNQITAFTGIPQGTISSSNQITELGYVSSIYTESFATTASNTFYGNQTINGDLFVNGDLTVKDFYIDSASVIYTSGSTKFGDTLDDTHQFTGSVSITGSISLNGQPIGTGKLDETIFNLYTQSNDNRLTNLESFTSSIDTTIKNKLNFESVISGSSQLTSSYDQRYILSGSITETTWDNIANKPSGIVSGSSQLTSSYDERYELRGTNIVSGSSQVNFNQLSNISANIVSSSTDTQNVDVIISGGSISANLKGGVVSGSSQIDVTQTQNYLTLATTGSNTFNGNQIINGDLEVSIDTIILTGSMFVSGTIEVDGSITGSLSGTATSASYVEYQNVGNKPTLVSGSSQLTGSYDLRYVLSGSITQTTWDNIANKPSGIVSSSSQIDIYNTTNYTNFSSSLNNTNLSQSLRLDQLELFTQSIDIRLDNIEIETGSINLRLDSLQLESGSIRSTFNSFTASYNTGSFSGSFTGSFFGTSSYALTASYIDGGFY